MKTKVPSIAVVAAVFVAAFAVSVLGSVAPAAALTGAGFNPGYVISDPVFFNSNAMTQAQVQAFLVSQETGCTAVNGQPCMYYAHTPTPTKAASGGCGAYAGSDGELASAMIFKVAQACGINPQVLLVTLQKEQGLVTALAPTDAAYQRAMGYGCPDSTGCDTQYYGLFNQIYDAAWQYRQYGINPSHFNFSVGTHSIAYSPTASCGSSVVNIENQATADLYNYTPYQPDAAALSHLTGTGDSCSSYGNRNFWVYFNSWFGYPGGNTNPEGVIDALTAGASSVEISGWAFDPDTTNSIDIQIAVNGGAPVTYTANGSRPDVNAAYGIGALHGYDEIIPVTTSGQQQVCVTAVNQGPGANSLIGCSTVSVITGAAPQGVVDSIQSTIGAIEATGWAFDRDTSDPINVSVSVNGSTPTVSQANISRPDVQAAYGLPAALHGYDVTVPVTVSGTQLVCVTAINVGGGSDTPLGCRTVTVLSGASPQGVIDVVHATPGNVEVSGWAFDRDTTAPINVQVSVNGGTPVASLANGSRPDVNTAYGGVGLLHGYDVSIPVSASGAQQVCVTAMNVAGGSNTALGCQTVVMPGGSPVAVIDSAIASAGQIAVSGWAFDPDTTASITMQVTVDGVVGTVTAGLARTDVAAAYPGYGSAHGYSYSVAATPGAHTVCVEALNVGAGSNASLGCRVLTEPSGSPTGVLDAVTISPGVMSASGWAYDPDTSASITVQFTVDGVASTAVTANQSRSDIAALYPGYGALHGFSSPIPATPGSHTICAYGVDLVAPGSTSKLGCKVVTASSGSPVGVVDSITKTVGGAQVSGWVWDPDTASPISVRIVIDGSPVGTYSAASARADVGAAYPMFGPLHGYVQTVPVSAGQHQVCVYGVNTGPGSDSLLGCSTLSF